MALLASTSIIPGLGPHHGSSVHPLHFALLYIALYTVALGTGGIKSNVSAFGADQFDEGNPDEMEQKKSFFNWFYFSVNVGSITAISIIVEIQVQPSCLLHLQHQHFLESFHCAMTKSPPQLVFDSSIIRSFRNVGESVALNGRYQMPCRVDGARDSFCSGLGTGYAKCLLCAGSGKLITSHTQCLAFRVCH